jgi:LacI family transcriptional regulator, xylobiose transport system transcriptional regulator
MTATVSEEPEYAPGAAPATIAQIAQLAGVSVPTVSKVVNGRAQVAPETRARVEAVIRSHGFQRRKRLPAPTTHVEMVFHELEGAYAMEAIRGAEHVAARHGMAVALSQLGGRELPGRGWVEEVLARRPSAVVTVFCGLTAAQHGQLRSRGIPVVALDPTGEPGHDTPSVGAGNWTGGLTATRHLLELGHRRVAAVTGPLRVLSSRARLDGYRAALDAAGLPIDRELVREGNFHAADGLAHARSLLRLPDPPTAIVTGNDLQALGVYQAAAEAGLRIPGDLSVVGFDDLPLVQWVSPPLTTVRQPLTEMAETATTMAIALSHGEALPQDRVEHATRLIIRASTAPPPGAA